ACAAAARSAGGARSPRRSPAVMAVLAAAYLIIARAHLLDLVAETWDHGAAPRQADHGRRDSMRSCATWRRHPRCPTSS
ncbi:MAG TPA: hypothetical protein VF516_05020, partial [Kofleriaceae bacterium]